MKDIVKKIVLGICMVGVCLGGAACTYETIAIYIESLTSTIVGWAAILLFISATFCLGMILLLFWLLGDFIIQVRENNK